MNDIIASTSSFLALQLLLGFLDALDDLPGQSACANLLPGGLALTRSETL